MTLHGSAFLRIALLVIPGFVVACGPSDPAVCGGPETAIGTVQGPGPTSPMVGQTVTVEGVVTAAFPGVAGLGGFVIEDRARNGKGDGDARTSDGIFVAAPRAVVATGARVRVHGTVAELAGTTALIGVGEPLDCGAADVAPRAVSLASVGDLEPFESMLVEIEDPLFVTDLHNLARRGQFVAATGGRLWAATHDGESAAEEGGPRRTLVVDDGSVVEPALTVPMLDEDRPPRVGDRLAGLAGVVLETDDGFVLHRTAFPGVEVLNPRPESPPEVGGRLRVAVFNVLNYFTTFGTRGADDAESLTRQEAKTVAALVALDADLVALAEIENGGPALGRLVEALNHVSDSPYRAVGRAKSPVGGDDIRVAFLYRPESLATRGRQRVLDDPVFRDRPMLAQTFRIKGEAKGSAFTAVAAHWKSKGGCGDAEGPDRDQGDGQGCWNDLRVREARRAVDLIAELSDAADGRVLLLGDLNAYGEEDPIDVLRDAGLVDLAARFIADPKDRYSYVYRGHAGRLDHAFATAKLAGSVTGAGYWHINADESRALDYRPENPEELYRPDPFRSSDHDPLLIGIE